MYFRDINLTSADSPPASKLAPNGDPYTALLFLDFNAMYLWSQQQEMPLGPGLRWIPTARGFRKFVLHGQTSISAVRWLQYEQTKINVQIQHAFHQGEKEVCGFNVDGFAVVDGVKTVWEYNGCTFHGCPCKPNLDDEQLEKQQKWIERKAKLEANGCKVIEMTDCEWNKLLAKLQRNPPKTELGRILCLDNQESLHLDHCPFWTIFILAIFDQV